MGSENIFPRISVSMMSRTGYHSLFKQIDARKKTRMTRVTDCK